MASQSAGTAHSMSYFYRDRIDVPCFRLGQGSRRTSHPTNADPKSPPDQFTLCRELPAPHYRHPRGLWKNTENRRGSVFADHFRTSFFFLRNQSVDTHHFRRCPVQGSETGPHSRHEPTARIFSGGTVVALLCGDGNLSLICARHASARSMDAVCPALRFRPDIYLG